MKWVKLKKIKIISNNLKYQMIQNNINFIIFAGKYFLTLKVWGWWWCDVTTWCPMYRSPAETHLYLSEDQWLPLCLWPIAVLSLSVSLFYSDLQTLLCVAQFIIIHRNLWPLLRDENNFRKYLTMTRRVTQRVTQWQEQQVETLQ